jgi:5-methylcytosine-specific restriction endonuclease McrA
MPLQRTCSIPCSLVAGRDRALAKKRKQLRKSDSERLEAIETITALSKKAQTAFNGYIRVRDEHKLCVSCGQSPYHGQRHASHFRPRSAASQLKFNVFNTNASCAQCNKFKSGNLIPYRVELVRRIGEERVQALENNNELANYSREYLIRLKEVFARRTKHLKKLRARLSTDF